MSPVDAAAVTALSEAMVRLTRAGHALRTQLAAHDPDGIEWAAYALLQHLVTDGPQRASALAEAACVDPSTVSRQVGELVAAGLVERRPDPADGRAVLLVATPAGEHVAAARRERRARTFARVVDGWSERDVRTLTRLLERFNDDFAAVRPQLVAELTSGSPSVREVQRA